MRRKTKLSDIVKTLEKYIETHGDADVSSISTYCNSPDKTQYGFNLCDLNKDTYESIGEIRIKYVEE